jgi:hypothetical protein
MNKNAFASGLDFFYQLLYIKNVGIQKKNGGHLGMKSPVQAFGISDCGDYWVDLQPFKQLANRFLPP